MPFKMPYTDARGVDYAESYWVAAKIKSLDLLSKTGEITLEGYASNAAYQLNKQAVAIKKLVLTPTNWDATLAALNLNQAALIAPIYQLALLDPEEFFADAVEVE